MKMMLDWRAELFKYRNGQSWSIDRERCGQPHLRLSSEERKMERQTEFEGDAET